MESEGGKRVFEGGKDIWKAGGSKMRHRDTIQSRFHFRTAGGAGGMTKDRTWKKTIVTALAFILITGGEVGI